LGRILATKRDVLHPADLGYSPEGLGDATGDYVHRLYPPQALRSMLKECQFVVVTVPLTEHTRGMLGAEELAALPQGAYLVDVPGGVVDYNAW
jgi:D-2-hydroxyacid dehydrogenase (NADP+)